MNSIIVILCCICVRVLASPPSVIVFILADDVGSSDVGFYPGSAAVSLGRNGSSLTPKLDALARDGVVLTQAHAHFMCTPSRCSLLSGRLPVHVQQGQDFPETNTAGMPRNMTAFSMRLKEAGWKSHYAGKWDLGIATPTHTPEGRGFNTSLCFAEHMVDSWTQEIYPGGTACTFEDAALIDLWSNGGPAVGINGTAFIEDLFVNRVLETIAAAEDPQTEPLFILWAPKALHYPLMVPEAEFSNTDWLQPGTDESDCNQTVPYIWPGKTEGLECRRQGWALTGMLDDNIGAIADALKARGWWNDSLVIFSSDNGAPLDTSEAGGNNFPQRGGKYSNWAGGVRVPSAIFGGYVPPEVRGTVNGELIHIADWYATILELAGLDPTDKVAQAAGLPPIDSVNMWPMLSSTNVPSPRVEIPISAGALISWPWKLIRGEDWWSGYTGPIYPNASSPQASPNIWYNCGAPGCLYNMSQDVGERDDLSSTFPAIAQNLSDRLDALVPSFWTNNDTGVNICPPNVTFWCGCWAFINVWGGYLGPYQY